MTATQDDPILLEARYWTLLKILFHPLPKPLPKVYVYLTP